MAFFVDSREAGCKSKLKAIKEVMSVLPYLNAGNASEEAIKKAVGTKQWLVKTEMEDFLRRVSADWIKKRSRLWQRDYLSPEAYSASIAPNRSRWLAAVGDPISLELPPPAGEPVWEPFMEDDEMHARWLMLPVAGDMRAHAVLALPKKRLGPLPLVVAQHGVSSSPESVMGLSGGTAYHGYGMELVRAGYAVLAPKHVSGGGVERGRIQRICLMLGLTHWGLEIYKLGKLLDYVMALPDINPDRLGYWGLSLGGAYALIGAPLEPRIKVVICAGWFNDRFRKMIVEDSRYVSFLGTDEEHVFIPRWLVEFGDADLASLICPRPLQIQHGKGDPIAWWPFVNDAYLQSARHYEQLGVADRVDMVMHEGGHEVRVKEGLDFLERFL